MGVLLALRAALDWTLPVQCGIELILLHRTKSGYTVPI